MPIKRKPLQFPKDELKHAHGVEWWYLNGHLKDADKNEYAFMHTLFWTDLRKFKVPFAKAIPTMPAGYFTHSVITDVTRQKTHPHLNYAAIATKDSFTKKLLHVHYTNPLAILHPQECYLMEPEPFSYELKTEQLDLRLQAIKPPILLGGAGWIEADGTYYYSLPRIKAEGTITIGKKVIPVKGQAWMDHEWANPKLTHDGWTWFCIQLTDKTDIVCYIHTSTKKTTGYACVSSPTAKQSDTTEVIITPIGKPWVSRETKTSYPVEWSISIPKKRISLTAKARSKNQEMIFGSIHYWEGPMDMTGTIAGKKVRGLGFAELVGYRSRLSTLAYTVAMAKKNLQQLVK